MIVILAAILAAVFGACLLRDIERSSRLPVAGLLVAFWSIGAFRASLVGLHGDSGLIIFCMAIGNALLVTLGRPIRMLDVGKIDWGAKGGAERSTSEKLNHFKSWRYQVAFLCLGVVEILTIDLVDSGLL